MLTKEMVQTLASEISMIVYKSCCLNIELLFFYPFSV